MCPGGLTFNFGSLFFSKLDPGFLMAGNCSNVAANITGNFGTTLEHFFRFLKIPRKFGDLTVEKQFDKGVLPTHFTTFWRHGGQVC